MNKLKKIPHLSEFTIKVRAGIVYTCFGCGNTIFRNCIAWKVKGQHNAYKYRLRLCNNCKKEE